MSRTMLVTGSSRGIGEAIARVGSREGYKILLHGKSASKQLNNLSIELKSKYICFDLTREDEIKKGLNGISKIDVLVNCAGINISKPFEELEQKDWENIYKINVFGLSQVIKHCLPIMRKEESVSRIINIGSVKGTYSAIGRVAYASSKAAVIKLTTGLAKELAPSILVNCVSPGFTSTEMTEETWSERINKQVDSILLGRMALPEEIAEVVMFLASERCTYMTGQNIIVDGGFGIKNQ